MRTDALAHLLENNRRWAAQRSAESPTYFETLSKGQDPDVLWIGCADSRVPATQIVGLQPGELFVHRNVANLAQNTDASAQCVVAYAVNELKVDHIIVCGHYGCGGVQAALGPTQPWDVERWIQPIRSIRTRHQAALEALAPDARWRRLCELNVEAQVSSLSHNAVVRDAWRRGHNLVVHGWMYDLADGLLRDLDVDAARPGR